MSVFIQCKHKTCRVYLQCNDALSLSSPYLAVETTTADGDSKLLKGVLLKWLTEIRNNLKLTMFETTESEICPHRLNYAILLPIMAVLLE